MPRPCPLCDEKYKGFLMDHVMESHPLVAWRVRTKEAYYNESLWCFCGFNCLHDETMAGHWRANSGLLNHVLLGKLQ